VRHKADLFRNRDDTEANSVTHIELFFDLVFVFAITQLSHFLLKHGDLAGTIETLILFCAVWWVWIHTGWVTNWLDPGRGNVRLMVIAMMSGGLVLSSAIPAAFEESGLMFATAYIAMQVGRTSYMVWASRGLYPARARNFIRILFWFLISVPFWIVGALLADPVSRMVLWGVALAIEYTGPFALFRMPGLGRSSTDDWDIAGEHMAERCALFIIIALGESVLVTGATFGDLPRDAARWQGFFTCFAVSAVMWWIYFDVGAKRASKLIAGSSNAGVIARNAYTYLHMPIVFGIVVTAVGDEKLLAHPGDPASLAYLLTAVGGPMIFLHGNLFFKWMTSGVRFAPMSHGFGILLLWLIAAFAYWGQWSLLMVAYAVTAAMIATAVWEWLSLHGGWQRWAPWMEPLFRRFPTN
jgi:low temperature requirement protein LtrA